MADDPYAGIAEPSQSADPYAAIATTTPKDTTPATPTPGFFKQLLSPYNTSAEEFGEKHPVLGVPVRTAAAAAGAFVNTVPAVYHAFADEPTAEEKAEYAPGEAAAGEAPGTQTSGLKRVGLGVKRLTTDPVVSAAKDYVSGKVTPSAALSVLPEAIGTGIGSYAAGKVGDVALSKVGELRTQMKGDGVQASARKFTNVESALKDEVKKVAEKQGDAETKHAEATDTVKERAGLAKKVDQHSVKLREQIGKVEESVHKAANEKFDAVREKIGNPETNPAPLIDAVKNVETNILQGIPENIKEFRSILGHGEEAPEGLGQAFEEVTGEKPLGAEPMTWDKLQSLKSRIDARLRKGGGLNGDLKRGLYSVQNTIVDTMGDLAKGKGADALWNDARNTWRQYKEDFHEPTGPSGSGSPVAASLDAKDPKNIRQPFVAKQATTGNRGIDILRKYPQHGGTEAAATAEELMGHHENLRRMPDKAAPKPLATPTVDANQVARDAIAKSARNWGSFNARDIGILGSSVLAGTITHLLGGKGFELPVAAMSYEGAKYTASRVMNNPKVIDWLSKTPPEEAAVLAKVPGADKVRIIDGLTQQVISAGKPVKLSPAATKLLGPRNVARIMAATGGVSSTRVQNRKDALDLLNPQPTQ